MPPAPRFKSLARCIGFASPAGFFLFYLFSVVFLHVHSCRLALVGGPGLVVCLLSGDQMLFMFVARSGLSALCRQFVSLMRFSLVIHTCKKTFGCICRTVFSCFPFVRPVYARFPFVRPDWLLLFGLIVPAFLPGVVKAIPFCLPVSFLCFASMFAPWRLSCGFSRLVIRSFVFSFVCFFLCLFRTCRKSFGCKSGPFVCFLFGLVVLAVC